jgi:chaperonin GroEL
MRVKNDIVKDLSFEKEASDGIFTGVTKLTKAVSSTLGGGGRCVIVENEYGNPVITKDGVTVAESIVLKDPVENMGATMVKEAAQKTVKAGGDGTTTATVLTHSILDTFRNYTSKDTFRNVREQMTDAVNQIIKNIDKMSIKVGDELIDHVAIISTNNDHELGSIIGGAFKQVGRDGVVIMEDSGTADTYVDIINGVQINRGLKSHHLVTNQDNHTAVLERPLVLIVESTIPNIRRIQSVLEYAIGANRSILIIGEIDQAPLSGLIMNKVKGNIRVNVIDPPHFGEARREALHDLAILTGATVINEDLGDDIDMVDFSCLGSCISAITDENNTVLKINELSEEAESALSIIRDSIPSEKDPVKKNRLERRLAMMSGSVGVIKVGASSEIELKEKKDRVEDAIHATKAAMKEGIVPGGGIALINASWDVVGDGDGYKIIKEAVKAPYKTILENAGLKYEEQLARGYGIDTRTGNRTKMVENGIVDPALVTKSALMNAFSVAITMLSTNCVISNVRA